MKLDRISLTVPKELLEKSEKIAKEKLEDRSTVIRRLLGLGLKQYMIQEALNQYSEGKISMEKAAELADISIWKFLDVIKERKIPIRYDLEDIEKEIEEMFKQGDKIKQIKKYTTNETIEISHELRGKR